MLCHCRVRYEDFGVAYLAAATSASSASIFDRRAKYSARFFKPMTHSMAPSSSLALMLVIDTREEVLDTAHGTPTHDMHTYRRSWYCSLLSTNSMWNSGPSKCETSHCTAQGVRREPQLGSEQHPRTPGTYRSQADTALRVIPLFELLLGGIVAQMVVVGLPPHSGRREAPSEPATALADVPHSSALATHGTCRQWLSCATRQRASALVVQGPGQHDATRREPSIDISSNGDQASEHAPHHSTLSSPVTAGSNGGWFMLTSAVLRLPRRHWHWHGTAGRAPEISPKPSPIQSP